MNSNFLGSRFGGCLLPLWLLSWPTVGFAADNLVEITEDFTADPQWDAFHTRIVGTNCPIITQDFGYQRTNLLGGGFGEIGGTIWSTRIPAYYAVKVGPFSLRNRLSASGEISIAQAADRASFFLGFFNASRQGWRPWSSMMIQMNGAQRGESVRNRSTSGVQVWFKSVTASWKTDGMVTDVVIPADGSVHTWSFSYDPDAVVNSTWPHAQLSQYFIRARREWGELYTQAKELEPHITEEELRGRLNAAVNQGLLVYDPRRGKDNWELVPEADKQQGAVTLQIDGGQLYRTYLAPGNRDEPMELDRFGIVNQQNFGRSVGFRIGKLNVNGRSIDLSHDPGWEGCGNRSSHREQDFHARQDFGFSNTNWAGESSGEIGGTFWRTEPVDPLHAYYADDVGVLTLEDPLSFSANIAFVDGQPDSSVWFGFFNIKERLAETSLPEDACPKSTSMGISIAGPSRVGYYLSPFCAPNRELATCGQGPVFQPTGEKCRVSFRYDPGANDGVGRITVTLKNETVILDLTPQQRAASCAFDRFGIATIRRGGKFVVFYMDDIVYTARRPAGYRPPRVPQQVIEVTYPKGGRKY